MLEFILSEMQRILKIPYREKKGTREPRYVIQIEPFEIETFTHNNQICLFAIVGALPTPIKSESLEYLMTANFLGQGTGGCSLGFDKSEKYLTLSARFDYEVNYRAFIDKVEEVINYIDYWKSVLLEWNK